jgi:hypothetical protein
MEEIPVKSWTGGGSITISEDTNMNITLLTSLILTGTLFLLGNQAHANPEAGFNESESQPAIDIVGTDNLSPTILRQVTIMCPRNGFLIAGADTSFTISPPSQGQFSLIYGISMDTDDLVTGTSHDHQLSLTIDNIVAFPGYAQRVDACSRGESQPIIFPPTSRQALTLMPPIYRISKPFLIVW